MVSFSWTVIRLYQIIIRVLVYSHLGTVRSYTAFSCPLLLLLISSSSPQGSPSWEQPLQITDCLSRLRSRANVVGGAVLRDLGLAWLRFNVIQVRVRTFAKVAGSVLLVRVDISMHIALCGQPDVYETCNLCKVLSSILLGEETCSSEGIEDCQSKTLPSGAMSSVVLCYGHQVATSPVGDPSWQLIDGRDESHGREGGLRKWR